MRKKTKVRHKNCGSIFSQIFPILSVSGEKRKKKKSYYAKLKRQEDDKMAELAAKYRDRAKERREGGEGQRSEDSSSSGAYHAVAPDVKGNFDAGKSKMVKKI